MAQNPENIKHYKGHRLGVRHTLVVILLTFPVSGQCVGRMDRSRVDRTQELIGLSNDK